MIKLMKVDVGNLHTSQALKDYFFALRNDPLASQMSRRPAVTPQEHSRWWQEGSDYKYLAVRASDLAWVGTIRVSVEGVISIIVDPQHRGHGHGREMLRQIIPIMRTAGFSRLLAEVAPENVASQKAFMHAGWAPVLWEVAT